MTNRFFRRAFVVVSLCVVFAVSLSGCSTLSYYSQSVVGHSRLMLAREPVTKLIQSAEPELKRQLELSIELRAFAVRELGLPDNGSYTHYVDLERDYPVWNVVAAPEFSLQAKQWCYPVIGCASYRGYFRKSAAQDYADSLQAEGYETLVGGATAYSTLGWFSDPILPSMLRNGDVNFAETLFHELAHQQLYINGDSDFNEAFATVVGEAGAKRWLSESRPAALSAYSDQLNAVAEFNLLISASKQRLQRLYQQALPTTEMKLIKQREFERLKIDYQLLKHERWQGKGWFDRWFESPLNNARLAAFSTYRERVPALERLLDQCGGDLQRFYAILARSETVNDNIVTPTHCR